MFAQICGTPGGDGPVTVSSSVNTYYPITGNVTMNAGSKSIVLSKVPATDAHLNNFGATPISTGDLILIIQMQDATIDYTNSTSYGSGTANSGLDGLGGTGFTALGNTGVFEYVIATNSVPLTGGNLTFKGTGTGGGVLNSFFNADATSTRGKRTFQIVRVPQYSNLTLTSNITTPPFNGVAGGVIAFNVSGTFNFAGYTIDGTARGFRGGYSPRADSDLNDANTYVGLSTNNKISGKGEGIAGTPRYMWDGYNQVDNLVEGMPGGSSGRGAPANAGGGGNDHNTGGGGGGNGGYGGLGGAGWQGGNGNILPATGGGRPGFRSYLTAVPFPRLVMGGGGGAGDANNASSGVKGGVGGAIILVNAGTVLGTGNIYANGGKGAPGAYSGSPDGAGGGGAGGTVLLNISNDSNATIRIEANGGDGGNTENDNNNEHGPGGGGGGGIISHNLSGTVSISASVLGGAAGKSNAGNGINHGAISGSVGYVSTFTLQDVPPNLQVNSNCFPILETTVKTLSTTSICNSIDEKVSYEVQIKNMGVGNAAGVVLDFLFPAGIEFDSATATYSLDATGPSGPLVNNATANNPLFGGFNIAQNGIVTITLVGKVVTSIAAGTYNSNAQAFYFDPTRTTADPNRKITPFTNAYGTVSKNYEGLNQSNVPGTNFIGTSSTADDITILALPTAPTVAILQSSCATPTGTVTVTMPANASGISYTLTGTNPMAAPVNNATGVFSGLVAGTYKVTTKNAQGCTSSPTTGIVINAVAGAPTTTGVSICQDGTGSLTASSSCLISESTGAKIAGTGTSPNTGAGTLVWSNPGKITSNNSDSATASVTNGGNTTVRTKYLRGTKFGFSIPVNAVIKGIQVSINRFSSVNNSDIYVVDNVVSLIKAGTITGDNKSTLANWSTNSTTVVDYGGAGDLWSGSWTPADINDENFGIALSSNITRTSSNDITASVDYMQITVNYTVDGVEWYSSSSGGTPIYTGSPFNPVGVTGSGLINTNTPGTKTYYAACTSGSSCRTATNFVINAKPTIIGTTPASRCDAGTATLGATASSGTINWYAASAGGLSLGTGTSFTTPSLSTTTSYYVDATENGCTTATRTEVVATINTLPTINSATESSRCGAGTVTLNATASTGATINWYAASTGGTSLGTGTNFTTPSLSSTTTYYVGATSAEGCPTASRIAVAAVINNISTITFTSGTQNPAVCAATAIPNTVYVFGGSATNAVVTNLPVGLAAAVDTSAKTVTISGTPTVGGTYTITTVGHTAPCAAATITGIVTVNTSAPPILSAITQPTCTVTTGSFTITNYDASYTYTITPSTGVSRAGSSVTAPAGNYTIKATVNSCDSSNTGFAINAQPSTPATPTISTSTTTTFCSGGNVVLTSSAASGNQWYKDGTLISGATATTYSAAASGVYTVITNNGTCSSMASAGTAVTVNQVPVVPTLSAVTQPTCTTATGSFTIDNYNAAYTYTITPSTGVTQTNGAVTAPEGSYTIKATLGACSSADSVAAVVNAQPSTPA
ncbi:beta strand repeat-containing protein, partial [Flavobacterium sp. LAR06]|uniref:beta strand repeat-containing protein n=1 Tax=Flavobacterium sp. LAR06 TaxID=3064897 RepID=UPI0035C03D8D